MTLPGRSFILLQFNIFRCLFQISNITIKYVNLLHIRITWEDKLFCSASDRNAPTVGGRGALEPKSAQLSSSAGQALSSGLSERSIELINYLKFNKPV